MRKKALIVSFHNVNIEFIVAGSNIYKHERKNMSEINVKVCDSTKCHYQKTCKKYLTEKEKQNENNNYHSNCA